MNPASSIGIIVLLAVAVWLIARAWSKRRRVAPKPQASGAQNPSETYLALRNIVFKDARSQLKLPSDFASKQPWAVVMDWGVSGAIATVVAVHDGTASIYLSTGGGNIGGGQSQEAIRAAAKNALSVAARHLDQMQVVTEYPWLVRNEQVYFYVLTDSGIYFAESTQQKLGSSLEPLSDLGNAMQSIITGYRNLPH